MLPDIVSGWPRVLQQKLDYGVILRSLGFYARLHWFHHPKLAPKINSMRLPSHGGLLYEFYYLDFVTLESA